MTLHSSKGLEYPTVFMVGMEEELFPSTYKIQDTSQGEDLLEEERRLCYVGMTRAMQELLLTSAKMRRIFGVTHVRKVSRFIEEIPDAHRELIDHAPAMSERRAWRHQKSEEGFGDFGDPFGGAFGETQYEAADVLNPLGISGSQLQIGARVRHPDFGVGVVTQREGSQSSLKVRVQFSRAGLKKFLVRFAPLELVT